MSPAPQITWVAFFSGPLTSAQRHALFMVAVPLPWWRRAWWWVRRTWARLWRHT